MGADPPDIVALFDEIDADNSGDLNRAELQTALRALGLPSGDAYVAEIMRQYDRNGDGRVDFSEFQRYVAAKEAAISRAFAALDLDRDGKVTDAEVTVAMRKLGFQLEPSDARRMVELLDRDNDQQVSFDEFRRFAVLLPERQLAKERVLVTWLDSADWMEGIEYRYGMLCMTPPTTMAQRFVAGGLAGAVSRTIVAPLERLRTMMMADSTNKSLRGTVQRMWADGALRGFWKGNGATVMKVVPQSAIQMSVYDTTKDFMLSRQPGVELSNPQRLFAGFVAGSASTAATYPLEALRTHISLGRRGGYVAITRDIVRERGMRGLYQGFGACMANTAVTVALGFTSYEVGVDMFRKFHDGQKPDPGQRGWIAGCAAIGVMAATMPLEVVSRRMQIQGSPGYPMKYRSMADAFQIIVREEGPRALWRGSLFSYMKVAPSIGIVRYLYEALMHFSGSADGIRGFRDPPQPRQRAAAGA